MLLNNYSKCQIVVFFGLKRPQSRCFTSAVWVTSIGNQTLAMEKIMEKKPHFLKALHWQIFLATVLSIGLAIIIRALDLTPDSQATVRAPFMFVGDLFVRSLKLIVLPLVVVSIISGIQQMGSTSKLSTVGWKTLLYYISTTFVAVIIGIVIVNLIQPGVGLNLVIPGGEVMKPTPILQVFQDIIPPNIFKALSAGKMLPTIFASFLFGIGLLSVGDKGKPVADLIESLNVIIFKIVGWVMATAPIGVFALFMATLLDPKLADLSIFFENLFLYMVSVVLGLGIHGVIALPLFLILLTKRNPLAFFSSLAPALLTAFSTASSSATYPITRERTIDAGVSRESADFVLPLGATINMDGTALYEAVAAVYIANAIGVDLSFGAQIIIVLTATLAAIGAAGVPSAGLVTMIIVLEAVGLPPGGYVLVIAVDRILDMCRTTVNVWGDAVGAAVVDAHLQKTANGDDG